MHYFKNYVYYLYLKYLYECTCLVLLDIRRDFWFDSPWTKKFIGVGFQKENVYTSWLYSAGSGSFPT